MPPEALGLDDIVAALRSLRASGKPIPAERTLAEQLGVTRHQLRRAIALLQETQEWPMPRAIGVPTLDRAAMQQLVEGTNPVEIVELRLALEPALVRLAALRASPADVVELRHALARCESGERAADIAFHDKIASATRNSLALAMLRLVGEIGRDSRVALQLPPFTMHAEAAEHSAIVDAIAARNPDAAERAMREHLNSAQRWITRGLAVSAA